MDDLDSADDSSVLHATADARKDQNVAEHSARLGLNINRGKSKTLKVNIWIQLETFGEAVSGPECLAESCCRRAPRALID